MGHMSSRGHRREEEGFGMSSVLHRACFGTSFQVGPARLLRMHPKQSKQGCPFSPESSIRARDIAGLPRENYTAYQEKQWVCCLKFRVLLAKEGRMVSAHPAHRAGQQSRKSEHPRATTMSRATTERRAVVMTYILRRKEQQRKLVMNSPQPSFPVPLCHWCRGDRESVSKFKPRKKGGLGGK